MITDKLEIIILLITDKSSSFILKTDKGEIIVFTDNL